MHLLHCKCDFFIKCKTTKVVYYRFMFLDFSSLLSIQAIGSSVIGQLPQSVRFQVFFSRIQYLHKLFTCDSLFVIQVLRQLIEFFAVFQKDLDRLFVLFLYQFYDILVNLCLCLC